VMMVSGAGTKHYFHQNHLYSVAAMTDSTGAVVERYRYDAYGKRTVTNAGGTPIAASTIGQQRGFTGYYLDAETGLYYARARMYSPSLGRFVNRDPWSKKSLESASEKVHPTEAQAKEAFRKIMTQRLGESGFEKARIKPEFEKFQTDFSRELMLESVAKSSPQWGPSAGDGYVDGFNLYAGYAFPNGTDPTGTTFWGGACRAACWAGMSTLGAAGCLLCAAGEILTVGGLAIPCTIVQVAIIGGAAGIASVCSEYCPP